MVCKALFLAKSRALHTGGDFVDIFLNFAFLFFVGCEFGWVLELFFRRAVSKSHTFINPGFLAGPYLPIYGFGLMCLYFLSERLMFLPASPAILKNFIIFVLLMLALTFIEYIAGVIFIDILHVKLWDYSQNRFNIKGIVCPLFSFFWGVLGSVYYFLIHPYILGALHWFSENTAFSFFIGMFFGIFFVDVCYSFHIVAKVRTFAYENNVVIRYEELKEHIKRNVTRAKAKYRFMFALHAQTPLRVQLKSFLEEKKGLITGGKAE